MHAMPERHVKLQLVAPTAAATPEEAAAIAAAIERFIRATATPPPSEGPAGLDPWQAAGILEGVTREPWSGSQGLSLQDPWINT
jgi:hypothetical protein